VTEPDAWIIIGWDSSEPDGGRLRPRHTGELGRTTERLDERQRGWTNDREVGRTTVVTGGAIRES